MDIWGDIFLVKPEMPKKIKAFNGYNGAGERSRTPDLLITNQLLYQLSYAGVRDEQAMRTIPEPGPVNNPWKTEANLASSAVQSRTARMNGTQTSNSSADIPRLTRMMKPSRARSSRPCPLM